jgi:XTP/dITP diphosphohydrolase
MGLTMIELVIATTNQGKLREIKELLQDLPIDVTSLKDYPEAPEIIEDGKTFRANAEKKALTIAKFTGKLTMGEDSGLEVDALNGAPGIYSARFSGEGANDKKNNLKLLRSLRGIPMPERKANYHCCAVLASNGKVETVAHGRCDGLIAERSRGENGFGYDPLFFLPQYNKTFGELEPAIKAKISHRAKALGKIRKYLLKYCECRR